MPQERRPRAGVGYSTPLDLSDVGSPLALWKCHPDGHQKTGAHRDLEISHREIPTFPQRTISDEMKGHYHLGTQTC